jgi:small-conductance mechanosensitive channel
MASSFSETLLNLQIGTAIQAILLILLGIIVGKIVTSSTKRALQKRLSAHQLILLNRFLFYLIFFLFLASAIQQLGFHIGALLGATGILTVAIGIASQTSMSNVISGAFIVGEKPFEIGDTIKINDIQGEVVAINFLSVRVRTPDNTMVRLPNETLVKSAITNLSFFPVRRVDLIFNVNYKSDLEQLKNILLAAAKKSICLSDPAATFNIIDFIDSAIQIRFSVWTKKDNYTECRTQLLAEINAAFEKNEIDLPSASYNLNLNTISNPLSIEVTSGTKNNDSKSY